MSKVVVDLYALQCALSVLSDSEWFKDFNSRTTPDWFVELAVVENQPERFAVVPEGKILVPIVPTEKMLEAGENTFRSGYTGTPTSTPEDVYEAMIKAVDDVS